MIHPDNALLHRFAFVSSDEQLINLRIANKLMIPDYQIVLPWPPTTNTYYRMGNGNTYLSEGGRAFKVAVQACVLGNGPIPHFDGRLKVLIKLHQPTRTVIDIDNRIKPTLDALVNAGVMDDDSQVDELTVIRMPIVKGGKCFVFIWEL